MLTLSSDARSDMDFVASTPCMSASVHVAYSNADNLFGTRRA